MLLKGTESQHLVVLLSIPKRGTQSIMERLSYKLEYLKIVADDFDYILMKF